MALTKITRGVIKANENYDTHNINSTGIVTAVTFTGNVTGVAATFTGDVSIGGTLTYQDVTNIDSVGIITARAGVKVPDSQKIFLGTGDDLQIYHDGSHSYVLDNGTGDLRLASNGVTAITKGDTEMCAGFNVDGAVELYYDNTKKFETTSAGTKNTGVIDCTGSILLLDQSGDDIGKLRIGTGSDLEIYHDGSNSRIKNTTGSLWLQSDTGIRFTDSGVNESMAAFYDNGAVELYYDGSKKFETTSGGVEVSSGNLTMQSNGRIFVGNGGNAVNPMFANVSDTNTGIAFPAADTMLFTTGGSERLRITSTGVDVTGSITCDGLVVDGTFTQSNGTGLLTVQDDNNTGNATITYISGTDSASTEKWFLGHASTNNQDLYVSNNAGGQIRFRSSNADRIIMQAAGHFVPQADNSIDLGGTSNRWRNIYTADLQMSNEGSVNDVDGTWGKYTIQEGENDLFLINRRNGKKYKFNLTEVD